MLVFLEETFATICQSTEGYDVSLVFLEVTWFAARLPRADRQAAEAILQGASFVKKEEVSAMKDLALVIGYCLHGKE